METTEDILREMRSVPSYIVDDDVGGCRMVMLETLVGFANRIEAARKEREAEYEKELATAEEAVKNWNRNYLVEAADNVNLKHEIAKLKAALKPILDIVMDSATSELSMEFAITETKRIYNSSKEQTK